MAAPPQADSGAAPVAAAESHPDAAVLPAPATTPKRASKSGRSSNRAAAAAPAVAVPPEGMEQARVDSAAANVGRQPVRRVRHKLRRVDLWSVLKISLCFYTAAMLIVLLTGVVLWLIADAAGVLGKIEKNIASLMSAPDYRIVPGLVLEGAALIGLVLVALLVILTVVGAALYNVFSDLFGGVEFTTIEEEVPARRRPA